MSTPADAPAGSRLKSTLVQSTAVVAALITASVLWLGRPAKAVEPPAGPATVKAYLIDDELTTPAATGEKDGWFGDLAMPCDFDSWYVEYAGKAICTTVDGPKGAVTITSSDGRTELSADAQQAISGWAAEPGGTQPPTRALLVLDGEPVGIVAVAGPGTVTPAT
ncbi:hypothetical protein [Actinoplanes derwentensis]|uniref:Uncharacterized protein n=1 Tax=Actinoplanes derwentensis TaxID=113562 RepID=A0A1H2CWW5_9ACTN|nr:hypothetical protein [Actinoplanes derwentensis]GID88379.1 hypothetical protein Ade03nite_73030 [Actinoplanes derwentensis]SDT74757.1 hypothetical protein SAMN04489716_7086 [Actinoplanes derwentensis]